MYSPLYLEFSNATQALLGFVLIYWFGIYMWRIWNEPETSLRRWLTLGPPARFQAAAAIFMFHVGDCIIRANVWFWRHEVNMRHPTTWLQQWPIVVGGIIVMCGMIFKIRVFSRPVGWAIWIWTAVLALLGAYLLTLIPY